MPKQLTGFALQSPAKRLASQRRGAEMGASEAGRARQRQASARAMHWTPAEAADAGRLGANKRWPQRRGATPPEPPAYDATALLGVWAPKRPG